MEIKRTNKELFEYADRQLSKLTDEEKEYLLPEDLQAGMRLGCQLKVRKGNVTFTWKKNKAG